MTFRYGPTIFRQPAWYLVAMRHQGLHMRDHHGTFVSRSQILPLKVVAFSMRTILTFQPEMAHRTIVKRIEM
jgi:hypothetical protein